MCVKRVEWENNETGWMDAASLCPLLLFSPWSEEDIVDYPMENYWLEEIIL